MRKLSLALAGIVAVIECLHAAEARRLTPPQRLEPTQLKAVHADRMRLARERQQLPALWVYEDYRAVLHLHIASTANGKAARQQVVAASRKAGVKVVIVAAEGQAENWRGTEEGVLFLPASEEAGVLRWTEAAGRKDLQLLTHPEKNPAVDPSDFTGMEVLKRHADGKLDSAVENFLKAAAGDPEKWRGLQEDFKKYPDETFGAGTEYPGELLAKWDGATRRGPLVGIGASDTQPDQVINGLVLDPYEVSFRHLSTHILATELTEAEISKALKEGHVYMAHDWLCDPAGFVFGAHNNLGAFPMGDRALMWEKTQLAAFTPVVAKLKLYHNGTMVRETMGTNLTYTAKGPGAYRLEAWLTVGGEERPWIYSNPVYLEKPGLSSVPWPQMDLSAPVEVKKDITYANGRPEDENKHKLDLYLPKEKKDFPVFIFYHGGAWRTGDRSLYMALGYRFAKEGIGTVVPSYRLGPKNKHPAQVEDAASAFAWTLKHIAEYGGDPKRIYIGGHSAGGHMAALLALDERYLKAHQVSSKGIRGVVTLSGVFDLDIGDSQAAVFGKDRDFRRSASPLYHISQTAPPFLVTYCQWDYVPLGAQARQFWSALKNAGVAAHLHFTPRESHISEVIALTRDDDPTAKALLGFIR